MSSENLENSFKAKGKANGNTVKSMARTGKWEYLGKPVTVLDLPGMSESELSGQIFA